MLRKILSLTLSLSLLFQYSGFAQTINLADYLSHTPNAVALDRFRPLSLRYFSYEPSADNFKILLDKGDQKDLSDIKIKDEADRLLTYFKIGLSLPNEKFWVNLRPDAEDQIIDPALEKTDLGKVLLEADLQLKKDTASLTSPQSKEGKVYWENLYKKAGELFGTENITIPTITRPWIVPGEIIVRESKDSAYIYKAVLKVMLEEDYLISRGGSRTAPTDQQYAFSDPRLKELNKYSTELIREAILPELTKRINSSKDYASLRQVYFSLILARWFKDAFGSLGSIRASERPSTTLGASQSSENSYVKLIDSGDLTNLTSKEAWSKTVYFNEYQKSFKDGEYNLSEKIYTPTGQLIRRYTSGGAKIIPEKGKIESFAVNSSPAFVGDRNKNFFELNFSMSDPDKEKKRREREDDDERRKRKDDDDDLTNPINPLNPLSPLNPFSPLWDKTSISGSPLVEDKELAKGLSGGLNNEGVNLFGLIENAFEGKGSESDRAGHQRVVKFQTDINIAGVACKTLEVSRYQQTVKGNGIKYRTIEFFADQSSSEHVLQIKVYNDGRIETRAPETISEDERIIVAAVIRKIFKAESLIILEDLFQKAGLNYNLVEQAIQNRQGTKDVWTIAGHNVGYVYLAPDPRIEIGETRLNAVAFNKLPDRLTINIYDRHNDIDYGHWIGGRIYPKEKISVILSNKLTRILPAMENANEIQINVVDMVLKALESPSFIYSIFRGRLLNALNAAKSSSAVELKEKKDEFKKLLAGILGVMEMAKQNTYRAGIDNDLVLLGLRNADETIPEIEFIIEEMDSVSDLEGLREKVNAVIGKLLFYKDAGRIDKEIGKLKEFHASLNADILADRPNKIAEPSEVAVIPNKIDELFSMGKFLVVGPKNDKTLTGELEKIKKAYAELAKRNEKHGIESLPLDIKWVEDIGDEAVKIAKYIITGPETASKVVKDFIYILTSGYTVILQRKEGVSSSLTQTQKPEVVGGIDLTQMTMLIQPQGGFASSSLDFSLPELSRAEIEVFDLAKELELIQRMASSGIDPIDERLKKYLAVCFARGKTGKEIDDLKLCLEDVFIAQQLDARKTPDGYKEVIVIADTRRYVLKESRLAAGDGERISLN